MLTTLHVENVCLLGSGSTECRYLKYDSKHFQCCKLSPEKTLRDKMVDFIVEDAEQRNELIFEPIGDNCSGYLDLSTVQQGYDKE